MSNSFVPEAANGHFIRLMLRTPYATNWKSIKSHELASMNVCICIGLDVHCYFVDSIRIQV